MNIDVDLVCCWVQLDEDYQRLMHQHRHAVQHAAAFRPNRYRDNGELVHSFRAAMRFMPWLRRVHIVTNGQLPPDEIRNHPKVSHVTHEQIFFDKSHLPTFSYHSIEPNLVNIPGLSEHFLITADDFFCAKPIGKDFFLTSDGLSVHFLEPHVVPERPKDDENSVWEKNLHASVRAIANVYGQAVRHPFTHMPAVFQKSLGKQVGVVPFSVETRLTAIAR